MIATLISHPACQLVGVTSTALFALFLGCFISAYYWGCWPYGSRLWSILIGECSPLPTGYFRFKVLYPCIIRLLKLKGFLLSLQFRISIFLVSLKFVVRKTLFELKFLIAKFSIELKYGLRILKYVFTLKYSYDHAEDRPNKCGSDLLWLQIDKAENTSKSNKEGATHNDGGHVNQCELSAEHIILANVRDHRHRTAGATDAGEERASASGVTAGRCSVHRSVRAISFIGNGCSSEVDKSESALAQESPGQPEAAPPEHGRGWPPSERPDPISRESENDSQSCHTDQCKTLSNEGQQSL